MYRLTYRSAKNAGTSRSSIQLTGRPPGPDRARLRPCRRARGKPTASQPGRGSASVVFDVVCGTLLGDGSIRAKAAMSRPWPTPSARRPTRTSRCELLAELRPTRQARGRQGCRRRRPDVRRRSRAGRGRTGRWGSCDATSTVRRRSCRSGWASGSTSACLRSGSWTTAIRASVLAAASRWPRLRSVSFTDADLQVLLDGLLRLGLPAKATRGRIYFDVATTRRLSELIAPYVPPVDALQAPSGCRGGDPVRADRDSPAESPR